MLQINQLIEQERVSAGLTQEEMAEKLGIKRSTYQYWEVKTPATDKIIRVARALNLPDDYFFVNANRGTSEDQPLVSEPVPYHQKRQAIKNGDKPKVPVFGGYTTLGAIQVYDDERVRHQIIAELPPELFPGCDHGERAKGDSMYPLIMNQALLVGKQCGPDGITYGEKYIIKTRTGIDTTKYVHPGPKKGIILLKAYNKSVPDQTVEISDIVFCCRVHWIINPT